jgi:Na+/H+-dicarboxylate symporter
MNMQSAKECFWKYLTLWVVTGAVCGCLLGYLFKETGATDKTFVNMVKTPGDLFTNGLKCILVPFIFSSMITSIVKLKTMVNGTKIGRWTFTYYFVTTVLAALLAVIVSLAIIVTSVDTLDTSSLPDVVTSGTETATKKYEAFKDGCGHDSELWCKVYGTLMHLVPKNIVDAMATGQLLGVMSFGIAVGMLIQLKEDGSSPIVALAEDVQNVMIRLMFILIAFTPIAVCSLLCWTVMNFDLEEIAKYVGILLAAGFTSQLVQAFVVYPLLYLLFTRRNPLLYIRNILPAITTAFATSSSAATFPWTLQCATENNKIPHTVANFVLPLGVTVNMDGTCMTLIVSVFWLAYAQGESLDASKIILMVITAAISSIGTAPIPSASLMYTGTVAEVAGVPLGSLFGVIVAVDWIRDRVRTVVNVTGDSVGVGIISHMFPMEDEKTIEDGQLDKNQQSAEL